MRLVVGGEKMHLDMDTSSPATSLLGTGLLLNSVTSDANQGAPFMTLDLKDISL